MEPLKAGLCGGIVCLAAALGATPTRAQLLSPGPLVEAHEALEGVLNCTQCHQLRQRGVATAKCLACHAPLRARIDRGRGTHARIDVSDCGSCHKDHAGRNADIVRFDSTTFQHADAGYLLEGSHAELDCSSCHTSERIVDREVRRQKAAGGNLSKTYLGLAASCRGCHRREEPHDDQFGTQACETCHANTTWTDLAPFDHALTDYPLTGAHLRADCTGCHQSVAGPPEPGVASGLIHAISDGIAYRGVTAATCGSCHADPHRRSFGNQCTTCHSTAAWSGVSSQRVEDTFNHRITGFPLSGAHAEAECTSCHTPQADDDQRDAGTAMRWEAAGSTGYPPPVVEEGCISCHIDYHDGDLINAQDGPDCRGCHTERRWNPSAFDFLMHQRTAFPLEGAHQAVLCEACHTTTPVAEGVSPKMVFAVEWTDCVSCHTEVDPHRGQFGSQDCAQCHTSEQFKIPEFDHQDTRFPLDSTHRLPCASCHVATQGDEGSFVRYAPLGTRCQDCHT